MRRREFIGALIGAAGCPHPAGAQQVAGTRRIGLLMSYQEGDQEGRQRVEAFRLGLKEAGWADNHNAKLDVRWYDGDLERAKVHAKEILDQSLSVMVVNGTPGLAAVRQLTATVPTVFVVVTNPVGAGFVHSLSRPGGNLTGFSTFEPEIGGKWLEGLKEIAPHIARVGVLFDPQAQGFSSLWMKIESIASAFGVDAIPIHARTAEEIDSGLKAFAQQANGGLIVLPTPINSVQRQRVFSLAEKHRLPAMYPFAFHARSGGLIAYGFDAVDLFRRAASYVDRIFKGENPGNLPVQAPTKFELAVNLKAANAIGLTVPASLLARADEVIE